MLKSLVRRKVSACFFIPESLLEEKEIHGDENLRPSDDNGDIIQKTYFGQLAYRFLMLALPKSCKNTAVNIQSVRYAQHRT